VTAWLDRLAVWCMGPTAAERAYEWKVYVPLTPLGGGITFTYTLWVRVDSLLDRRLRRRAARGGCR
jgi:hypothetical protein